MARRWIILLCVAAAVLVGLLVWRTAGDRRLNVLLITLDTTRADRLGCYGYEGAETPALDRLAAGGLLFREAFTPVPLTLPAHASILTGLDPPEHGLRDNGRGRLPGGIPTLAEAFRERGYSTAAFLASFVLDRRFGLARGFEVYDDRMESPARAENVFDRENPADVVCDRTLAWLEEHAGGPFFAWVHFFDPHEPYAPPQPFRARHTDAYNGEIAFMDSQVARLLDFLDRRGLADRTLVVVCGDHGEAFGEHGERGHGLLVYRESMQVPLILRLPGRIPAGRSNRIARLTDVSATIGELLGWRDAPGRGLSLLGDRAPSPPCYGESLFAYYTYGWAPLYSLRTERWTFIRAPTPELYDAVNDRGETINLATDKPDMPAAVGSALDAVRASLKQRQAEVLGMDRQAEATLRSLGYAGGEKTEPPEPVVLAGLRNPKDGVVSVHGALRGVRRLMENRRWQEAADSLDSLLRISPESVKLREMLAECCLESGSLAAARPHIEAVLARDPGNRAVWVELGGVHLAAGRLSEAVAAFERALSLPPTRKERLAPAEAVEITNKARVNLAVALARMDRLEEAAVQYRLVLRDVSDHREAGYNLGRVLLLQGKREEAIEQFRKTVAAFPDLRIARETLDRLLIENGAGK